MDWDYHCGHINYHKGIVGDLMRMNFMNKKHKVNANNLNIAQLNKFHIAGHKFICDKCNSELIIALTLKEANKLEVIPGVYCPHNGKHINVHIYLSEVRDKMHKLFEKIDKQDRKNKKH